MNKPIAATVLASVLGLGGAFTLVDQHEWTGRETTTYKDVVGINTICRGHTGRLAVPGYTATREECDKATVDDLLVAYNTVKSCVKVPLTPGEVSGWTSFAYTVGPGKKGVKDGMCMLKSGREPSHVRLLNAGKPAEACAMMAQWTKAGGKVYRGLERRRVDEMAYCYRDLK